MALAQGCHAQLVMGPTYLYGVLGLVRALAEHLVLLCCVQTECLLRFRKGKSAHPAQLTNQHSCPANTAQLSSQ